MEKTPTSDESSGEYNSLRQQLLIGSISFTKVRNILLQWDQSSLSRDASFANLDFLLNPEITEFVNKNQEIQDDYYGFLSFTEFHVAQNLALGNHTNAISHFIEALKYAKARKDNEGWIAYVAGTILYMQGIEIPEEIIEKVNHPRNAEILINFNQGLKERGSPLYAKDYAK